MEDLVPLSERALEIAERHAKLRGVSIEQIVIQALEAYKRKIDEADEGTSDKGTG